MCVVLVVRYAAVTHTHRPSCKHSKHTKELLIDGYVVPVLGLGLRRLTGRSLLFYVPNERQLPNRILKKGRRKQKKNKNRTRHPSSPIFYNDAIAKFNFDPHSLSSLFSIHVVLPLFCGARGTRSISYRLSVWPVWPTPTENGGAAIDMLIH